MHTILLFAAYLSATTLATPVAQVFDTFEGDIALLNGQGIISNPLQDFSEPGYVGSTGQEQEGGYPPALNGDATTTNYLQAQVPSQDIFSSSGAGCPTEELFCCQGGSGPPGTLMSDSEFQGKCITYSEQNEQDDKCQLESNGSCCQSGFGAGAEKVWQCVTTPIKVVPQEHRSGEDPPSEPEDPEGSSSGRDRSTTTTSPARSNQGGPNKQPLLNHGKGNWGSL